MQGRTSVAAADATVECDAGGEVVVIELLRGQDREGIGAQGWGGRMAGSASICSRLGRQLSGRCGVLERDFLQAGGVWNFSQGLLGELGSSGLWAWLQWLLSFFLFSSLAGFFPANAAQGVTHHDPPRTSSRWVTVSRIQYRETSSAEVAGDRLPEGQRSRRAEAQPHLKQAKDRRRDPSGVNVLTVRALRWDEASV